MAIRNCLFPHNKKGLFFTFIAILLIIVLTIVFKPKTETPFDKEILGVKTRVTKINNFVTDFEETYLERILRLTTYKALTSLTYYMDVENRFLTDLQGDFREVLLYGTINNNPIDSITGEDIMTNNTFINWTNRVKSIAEESLNVDLNFTIVDVNINQTTPWFVDAEVVVYYSISSETAYWKRNNVSIKSRLGVENLYDPWYYVNTDGAYKKKVVQTDIRVSEWNSSNLKRIIANETYFHLQGSNASDFLMRFTNTFSPSPCCGIESMVNPNKITPSDVIESYVDYHFWNHTYADHCEKLYNITDVWDDFYGFKLDLDYTARFNVTNAVETC
jgi:hypothetical protein